MKKTIFHFSLLIFLAGFININSCYSQNERENIDGWLTDFTPYDVIKIGPNREFTSLDAYFADVGEISNVHIIIDEGTYVDENLYVRGDNFIIEGTGKVNLYCTQLYSSVMDITGENILIKNMRMRHFNPGDPENQNCSGRVIMFDNADHVIIDNCDLNGCGLAGLHDNLGNSNILIRNCYIHNNSLGAYTNIDGGVWQDAIDDHPVFVFENNRIENNGPDRVYEYIEDDEKFKADTFGEEVPVITHMSNEIELWNVVENPLIVKYIGTEFGDYFHLMFEDENSVQYDFGFGDNNYGEYELFIDTELNHYDNPKYINKTFELHWEWKLTTYPCCDGEYNATEGYQPSIIELKLINQ